MISYHDNYYKGAGLMFFMFLTTEEAQRQKEILRREIFEKRRKLSKEKQEQYSEQITEFFLGLLDEDLKDKRKFFVYAPMQNEVNSTEIINELLKRNKIVTVPLVKYEGIMVPVQIYSLDDIRYSGTKIPSPLFRGEYSGDLEVCITPCVAFDERGNRLGRGRGCYDKFFALPQNQGLEKVALAFETQMCVEIPLEKTDIRMDRIITESGIILANRLK